MATSPANKLSRGVVGLWPKTGGCGPLHTHTHIHLQLHVRTCTLTHTHTGRHREGRNFLRLLLTDAVFVVGWYPHFVVVVVGWNPIGIWQKRSPRPLPKQKYRASCSLCLICVAFFALLCETFNDILNLPNTFCVCLLHLLKYTRHTHKHRHRHRHKGELAHSHLQWWIFCLCCYCIRCSHSHSHLHLHSNDTDT